MSKLLVVTLHCLYNCTQRQFDASMNELGFKGVAEAHRQFAQRTTEANSAKL